MIAGYLLDPSRPRYDLEGIALRNLGYNLSPPGEGVEFDKKGQGELVFSGDQDTLRWCERSDIILRLHDVLEKSLKEKHLLSLFKDVEMPLVRVIADMEEEGVGIDVACLKRLSREMKKKLDDTTKKIYELAGEEFNINSPKQLQVILFDKLGLPRLKRTKTGASTDESVLTRLAKGHELPAALLEYRAMSKLKSGYYDSILELVDKKDEKLHANFNQAVTATGRLSSSEPNLQNIPVKTAMGKEIRRAFVSGEEGKVLLAADYSQIELRVLAHLSDDKNLIEAFRKGEDIHRDTASRIFGCKVKDVTDEMRSAAKTVNFGITYGMSSFRLARDLEIDFGEAQSFIDSYFNQYSGVKKFMDRTVKDARKKGFVTTLLNRRRYVPEITSKNERLKSFAERVAINTPVQGSAADLIKLAMIACHEKLKDQGIKMLIQVHDELVFKVPESKVRDAAKKVKEIMENVISLKVPLKIDIEAGKNWLDMEGVDA
jgi:DNA polymerase-1